MSEYERTLGQAAEKEGSVFTTEQYKLSKFIIEVEDIPPVIKAQLWAYFNRVMELSNITREDVQKVMMAFDDTVLAALQSIPKHKYTWTLENYLTNARSLARMVAYRSTGGTQRERAMLVQQIKQFLGLEEGGGGDSPKGGFLSRFGIGGRN